MKTVLSPSLLAADHTRLGEELKRLRNAGVPWAHIDVMDGHFVPNLSFGVSTVAAMRKVSDLFFDVHLMLSHPAKYAEAYANAGADIITFHIESEDDPDEVIRKIRSLGKKVGISVKPGTDIEAVYPYIEKVDMVLIMTVEPGFGGQKFMPEMLPKIAELRDYLRTHSLSVDIEIDGGVTPDNVGEAVERGANVIVAGSSVFRSSDMLAAVRALSGK